MKKSIKDLKNEEILQERRKRIFSLRNLLLLIISLFLVYYLLVNTDLEQAITAINNINHSWIVLSVILYLLSNYLKSLRFAVLLKHHSIDIRTMFGIVSYQNFFNLILPARTGELTLIYYLKKLGGINISIGIYSLLYTRIVDLVVVAMIFIISSIIKWGLSFSLILFLLALAILLLSVFGMFMLDSIVKLIKTIVMYMSKLFKINNKRIIQKVFESLDAFYEATIAIQATHGYSKVFVISIIIWLNLYLIFYYNIKAFTGGISFNDVLIGATGAVLTNVLPINSFGSFGTLEAGWTGGFLLVGMSLSDAIITGFGSHFIMLGSAAIIVVLWKIYDTIMYKQKKK